PAGCFGPGAHVTVTAGLTPEPSAEPELWPRTVMRGDDGALTIGGVDVRAIAAEFGTPAYVLDEADFRGRARAWRDAIGDGDVYYATKAFLCTTVARWMAEDGIGLDVSTGGELAVAIRAGVPGARIVFHGNNKSMAEIRRGIDYGVGRFVCDSYDEIDRVASAARDAGVRQRVFIRVTPGVEAHTHEFISTGQEDQKFGFSLASGAAGEAVRRIIGHDSLELTGLHCHIGSQIFDTQGFSLAAHRMVGLLATIRAEHGIELPELDLGGGHGIAYTPADAPIPTAEFVERLRAGVAKECAGAGFPLPRLSVEPGRSISGPSTITLYEVGTIKELEGVRTYVSIDGGMSDNIRTSLYDAHYTALLASRHSEHAPKTVTVCGKHCESGDIVVRHAPLPADLAVGDLIAVPATGAYHRSMGNNYNHVPRPPVIAVRDGRARVIVRRETEEDLLRLDVDDPADFGAANRNRTDAP
ncbi:MAG: diaminopimelate decarboxylase, partial [Frankiaceae bacterium]|nr:diaminopimelate decarboxylase [Frankiaceae bacterium]